MTSVSQYHLISPSSLEIQSTIIVSDAITKYYTLTVLFASTFDWLPDIIYTPLLIFRLVTGIFSTTKTLTSFVYEEIA